MNIDYQPDLLECVMFLTGKKHEGDCYFTDKADEGCPDCKDADIAFWPKIKAALSKAKSTPQNKEEK
jgi:hypothetical protein